MIKQNEARPMLHVRQGPRAISSSFCHLSPRRMTACPSDLSRDGQMVLYAPPAPPAPPPTAHGSLGSLSCATCFASDMASGLAHAHCKHLSICFNTSVLHCSPQIAMLPPHASVHPVQPCYGRIAHCTATYSSPTILPIPSHSLPGPDPFFGAAKR